MKAKIILLLSTLLLVAPGFANSSEEPRGIRSNNPGNIVKSAVTWNGEVGCPDSVNECFMTEYHGIRAMVVLLNNYYEKYNVRTVEDVVARWGPKEESYQHRIPNYVKLIHTEYIKNTCGFRKQDVMTMLIAGIIHFENGYNPYKESYIHRVVDDVLGKREQYWNCALEDYRVFGKKKVITEADINNAMAPLVAMTSKLEILLENASEVVEDAQKEQELLAQKISDQQAVVDKLAALRRKFSDLLEV